MEQLILNKLKWNLSFPTAYDFIALWMPHVHSEINPRAFMTLSEEAVGVCIKGAEFFKCRPSVLAAGVAMWVHAALEQPVVQFETAVAQDLGEETMSLRDEDEVGSMCVEACLEEVSEQLRHRYPVVYVPKPSMMFVPKPSCKGPMKKPVPHKNGAPA